MSKMWFVGETVRNRQDEAALSVAPLGMEAYVPAIIRTRRRGHHVVEEEQPRFGTYIFVRFQRDRTIDGPADPWPELLRGRGPVNAYFKRFLCYAGGLPMPVPEQAIRAVMGWTPPKIEPPKPHEWQVGDVVLFNIGPVQCRGIITEINRKKGLVSTWDFGDEKTFSRKLSDLEPAEAA